MKGSHRAPGRLPALIMLTVLLAAPAALGQAGAPPDVFTVASVPVDATAASAAAAREAARLEGQRRAIRTLLERLTLAADAGRLPRPTDAQLTDLVRDFEVANERRSAVRYLADYTFRFRPPAVRGLLQSAGIPFAETMSKPVTVLPVLTDSKNASLLWDDPNPWRDAWANRKVPVGLVPLLVPLGDASDVAAIGAEKALAGDPDALAAITARYGSGDALIAQAKMAEDGSVATALKRVSGSGAAEISSATFRPAQGESPTDLMTRAVTQSIAAVEDAWKHETLLPVGQEAVLTAEVPIGALSDWLAVRTRLNGLAAIKESDLVELDKHKAQVEIHYLGDPDKLRLALAQRDLVLSPNGTGWTLQRRSAAGAAE